MKIGIIGLGLIGASFGRAILKNTENEVFAYDISEEVMVSGELLSCYNYRLTTKNAKSLDYLFIALYPNDIKYYIDLYCPILKKGCVVSDLCGNKRDVVDVMKETSKTYPDLNFVSCHPMAGREFSGVKHSTSNLFDKASMIMVPVSSDIEKTSELKQLAFQIGFSKVVITTAENHDKMIAFTSQLAHIISSSYIKNESATKHGGYSAGSFRDMTRVAKLNPKMWTELMLQNSDNLSKEIDELVSHLNDFSEALKEKNEEKLYSLLEEGNERKLMIDKTKGE